MSNPFLIPAAGNANRLKTAQSLDKLRLEKFIAPLVHLAIFFECKVKRNLFLFSTFPLSF